MPESISDGDSIVIQMPFPGRAVEAFHRTGVPDEPTFSVDDPIAIDPTDAKENALDTLGTIPIPPAGTALTVDGSSATPGFDFFETFHVIARSYDFGNVLATQQQALEVFSAYRRSLFNWTTFVNGAGAGTSLVGIPTLPEPIEPLTSEAMTLTVDVVGPAIVNDTLDFTFSDGATIMVPIEFKRIILISFEPEIPMVETLEFLVDIKEHKDGTEQRISLRTNPRQFFDLEYKLTEGRELATFDNVLFEWQARLFGLPIWHERTPLTVAASINDTVINVGQTAFRDFRVGGLVVVLDDDKNFDVQTIATGGIAATTLTFTGSGLLNAYSPGVAVMPLRTAQAEQVIAGQRARKNLALRRMVLQVLDNDTGDIASTAAFSTYNGKVLLDDCNLVRAFLPDSSERRLAIIDGRTGTVVQESPWDRGRRRHAKGFRARGVQATWELRQLLHALNGPQVSYYIPTFYEDLVPNAALASGGNTMSIVNVGYNRFAQERQPRDVIRVVFQPSVAQAPLVRVVQSSLEVDDDNETLTLDTTWPATFAVADVLRVEYVEKSRFDTQKFRFRHGRGVQSDVRMTEPVKVVLE